MFRPAVQRHQPLPFAVDGVDISSEFDQQPGASTFSRAAWSGVASQWSRRAFAKAGAAREQNAQLGDVSKRRGFKDVERRPAPPQNIDHVAPPAPHGEEERPI